MNAADESLNPRSLRRVADFMPASHAPDAGAADGVWFPPGPSAVLLPRNDRRCAARGVTLYAASRRSILIGQWAAWAWVKVFGPRSLPGRTEAIENPYLAEISAGLGLGNHGLTAVASYRRRDVRSGLIFIATGSTRAYLIKVRSSGERLEREQQLLDVVQRVRPAVFQAPRPLGLGTLSDGNIWSAQEMVFTAPHAPCTRLPAGFESDLSRVLAASEPFIADGQAGWHPSHGDLSPWNLRRDHRGRLWLFDWEDACAAPIGADRAYFEAAVGSIRPRRRMPYVEPAAAAYWSVRIEQRLAEGHPEQGNREILDRLQQAAF